MKLVIVEEKAIDSKKVIRILRLTDPSLQVISVVKDIQSLLQWLEVHNQPDIVLIHQNRFGNGLPDPQSVQARLVLKKGDEPLTYFAFRTYSLLQWWKVANPQGPPVILPLASVGAMLPVAHQQSAVISIRNRFLVQQGQRFFSIPINKIAYFFSDGKLVYLVTFQKDKYTIPYRIEDLQRLLNPIDFYRVNRSYVVSLASLQQITAYFGGRFKLKLIPPVEEVVLVSKNRAQGFKQWLGE